MVPEMPEMAIELMNGAMVDDKVGEQMMPFAMNGGT